MDYSSFFHSEQKPKQPVDYVDPRIGGISHLLVSTLPIVHLPNSMVRLVPDWMPESSDWFAATKINGFSLNMPAHRSHAVTTVMPTSGELQFDNDNIASNIDHDFELCTPYNYAVLLEDSNIIMEYSPTARAACFHLTTIESGMTNIIFRCREQGSLEWLDENTICGWQIFRGTKQYFYAKLSKPGEEIGTFIDNSAGEDKLINGERIGAYARFNSTKNDKFIVKSAISFISIEQAEKNLYAEIPVWDFEKVKLDARQLWNDTLGKIEITTHDEAKKRSFYTALYRGHERMINVTEDGHYFSAYDNQVHKDERPFYVDDWIWDTYRSTHPLRLLLFPQMEQDMVQSYVRMYEQSGLMPTFPQINGDLKCMIGHHQASLITDTFRKGFRDFDIEKAYEGLRKNAMEGTMVPWREGPATELDKVYREKGFFPAIPPGAVETELSVDAFENRQSIAVTMDHAYDDWCLAQLAKKLGKEEDYELFSKRGKNYKNVFHPEIGFVVPKTADGEWILPFDPKFSGEFGGRQYFAEMNSWTYTWHVQHDVEGLIELMGGKEKFLERLDQLFHEDLGALKRDFLSQFPDSTGLVGQYAAGNEQSFHIPYLFNFAGAPWKTQKRIRQIMDTWFRDDVMGICGDEDGGAMSSWYAFSALGFYPVCPGSTRYQLGSPLFKKSVLHLGNGEDFVIKAENVSAINKYIQSAKINDEIWNKCWFDHDQIKAGAEIILNMGPRPNKDWGVE
jgi:predicted alpha-1,2-mannosidase